jgi:hypothetical protein
MSNDKPRLVEVTDKAEIVQIIDNAGALDFPHGITTQPGKLWADADDLKRWRKLRESQRQSGEKPT